MMHLVSTFHGFAQSRSLVLISIQYELGHTEPKTNASPAALVANTLLSAVS